MMNALGSPQRLLLLGGTSDIALAVATRFARIPPLDVVVAARPSVRRSDAVAHLEGLGCSAWALDFEARAPRTHVETVRLAAAEGDIDVAVVAFGVLGDPEGGWTDVEQALTLAETNYVGAISCGVALADLVRKQGHGVIVVLSSTAAERPRRSNFAYGSTKVGVDAFYTGLSDALRQYGGRVVVVRPGFVRSKMTAGLKVAPLSVRPEQVADAVVRAVADGTERIWVPRTMRFVMSGLRHLPRPLFRRLPL